MSHTHRVLIVEDDYAFRWSLAMRCQRRSIEADIAESVNEADELIRKYSDYCGVLLDLRMGKKDGTALLDLLADRSKRPNVVVVTAYPDVWERVADQKDRASLVSKTLVKPVDVDVAIEAALQHCA